MVFILELDNKNCELLEPQKGQEGTKQKHFWALLDQHKPGYPGLNPGGIKPRQEPEGAEFQTEQSMSYDTFQESEERSSYEQKTRELEKLKKSYTYIVDKVM